MKKTIIFLVLAAVCFLFIVSCSGPKGETPQKVVVIGLDGIGWNTLDPMIERGVLPFFKKLKAQSAWGHLKTLKPTISPLIWTSIATGQDTYKHEVKSFTEKGADGSMTVVDSQTKKAASLWSILNLYQKKSAVINWWVTYPPERLNGVMVSDMFIKTKLLKDKKQREQMWDTVFPRKYFPPLLELLKGDFKKLQQDKGIPDFPKMYNELNPGEEALTLPVFNLYDGFVMQELLVEKVTNYLLKRESFDFFATYFVLPDITQHMVLSMLPPDYKLKLKDKFVNGTLTPEEQSEVQGRINEILIPIFQYADSLVEQLMTHPDYQDATFFIVSDHGFEFVPGGYDHKVDVPGREPPAGIFIARGPEIKKGFVPDISVLDLAPSVLHLFGLPVGEEMDGKVREEIFTFKRPVQKKSYPLQIVRFSNKRTVREVDEKKLEELRSLGYIE